LIFRLLFYRFHFRSVESVYFPPGKAGNVLRGALGTAVTGEPSARPSGLADPPRPFVLRAGPLDGKRFGPGETFSLDLHVFDLRRPLRKNFVDAFAEWARTGIGPRRGRVELLGEGDEEMVTVNLAAGPEVSKCSVAFRTPTELKGSPSIHEIPFNVLLTRARDRISTLRGLYGEGPLPIDFHALGERAALVRTVESDLQYCEIMRRSSRTGAEHGIGGVTGRVDYAGDLTEFLPYLRAAFWTGVGRHTVWGNGAIEVVSFE
jgi:CRISPR-associated endoribonuclease Cas6